MQTLIETERLIMRKFTMDDVDAVFEFGSCPLVSKYTCDGVIKSKQEAARIIQEIWLPEYENFGYARYALVHKADDRVIGFCGLKFEPSLGAPDLGYRMLQPYWGRGLGMEAATAAFHYARDTLGLNTIMAEVIRENVSSSRILQKLGFVCILTYEQDGFTIDRYRSDV